MIAEVFCTDTDAGAGEFAAWVSTAKNKDTCVVGGVPMTFYVTPLGYVFLAHEINESSPKSVVERPRFIGNVLHFRDDATKYAAMPRERMLQVIQSRSFTIW